MTTTRLSGGGAAVVTLWQAAAAPVVRVLELAASRLPGAAADAEAALAEARLRSRPRHGGGGVAVQQSQRRRLSSRVHVLERGATIRYTTEVAVPRCRSTSGRVGRALDRNGGGPASRPRSAAWQQPAAMGAWAGGRHSETGSRRKIYVETAAGATPAPHPGLPAGSALQFVGLGGDASADEHYFRRDRIAIAELGRCSTACPCARRSSRCTRGSRDTAAFGRRLLIPADAGFSITAGAIRCSRRPERWGSDRSIRRSVLALASPTAGTSISTRR